MKNLMDLFDQLGLTVSNEIVRFKKCKQSFKNQQ